MDVNHLMRSEWNRRALDDPHYFVAFGQRGQDEDGFFATAAENLPSILADLDRLPADIAGARRALEIGCGPGRLLRPMSAHFAEIHGVDISEEMVAMAQRRLSALEHAHVHTVDGSDLSIFQTGTFDFVYSYAVFQHIPDLNVVLSYVAEAVRVLKQGGIARFQLRGAPPLASEMQYQSATWTGCWIAADDLIAYCRQAGGLAVAVSGEATQYMWISIRKPDHSGNIEAAPVLAGVTGGTGFPTAPLRGHGAAVSLWFNGLPDNFDLADVGVSINGILSRPCWIGPRQGTSGYQINALLPKGIAPGPANVEARFRDAAIPARHSLEITLQGFEPRLLRFNDGIDLCSTRVETGSAKVIVEDIEDPAGVRFRIGGRLIEYVEYVCIDPVTDRYEYAFAIPPGLPQGLALLEVENAAGRFANLEVELSGQ